jgi:hypothetical protein
MNGIKLDTSDDIKREKYIELKFLNVIEATIEDIEFISM